MAKTTPTERAARAHERAARANEIAATKHALAARTGKPHHKAAASEATEAAYERTEAASEAMPDELPPQCDEAWENTGFANGESEAALEYGQAPQESDDEEADPGPEHENAMRAHLDAAKWHLLAAEALRKA